MEYTALIGSQEAASRLYDPDWVFIDCRFVLGQPDKGRDDYVELHIDGSVYADLEKDLSGQVVGGQTGRHPLPAEADFDATVSRLGVEQHTQVIAYDESTGAMAAARMWWLLKWAGHDRVAVLDGGFRHWTAAGLPVARGWEERPPTHFAGRYRSSLVASTNEVLVSLTAGDHVLVDARASERYRGENETIDPVAGHIPGAISIPYTGNVTPEGTFHEPSQLRERFEGVSRSSTSDSTIFYCGSGVTAAHNVLAYAHAGLGPARLYPGSWSEWITDPSRPTATGDS